MLILQTDRDSLLKPLQTVTGIVEHKHTLPILSNVLLENLNGQLNILATDLEIQIHTYGTENDQGDFKITTNAKKLQDILRALPDSAIVQLDLEDSRLTLKAGKSRFHLQTQPAKDFPVMNIADNAESETFALTQETLKQMISQVQYGMGVQDIRYYLNGLLLQVEDNQLRLIASDGNRLAYIATTIDAHFPKKKEVILPRKTVVELMKLLSQPNENVEIELLDKQVHFRCNQTVVVSKIIDGKFPDYNRVIPMDNETIFVVSRESLLNALERSAILANEKLRGVKLFLSPGLLRISCTNSDQEEAQEELEVAYQGSEVEMGFNIKFLIEAFRNMQSDDIQVAFGKSLDQSALFTIPDESNFKYVVMPLRL